MRTELLDFRTDLHYVHPLSLKSLNVYRPISEFPGYLPFFFLNEKKKKDLRRKEDL
jgi:hypothetical protein